jgi:tetratricopeptide (TPR) repeat protein
MAEGGLLSGVLGGGEDESVEAETGVSAADAMASAVAVDAARFDPELSRKVGDYLDEQRRLVKIQTEHLHEQREVQLSHLKLRRFTDRLKAGTQLFFILIATVLGLGLCVMVFDAFSARSVVVEAFKAPPALASRGVSGDVVASGVLDNLQKLQDATRSSQKGLAASTAWSSDIKVEVPGTGVSLGEVNRLLRQRFGHDLHIEGDLVQTDAGGLALTVRGDGLPAASFAGASGDLNKLTTEAAEYIYGRSQPLRYGDYLAQANRNADLLAFAPAAYAREKNPDDKAMLGVFWGDAYAMLGETAIGADKLRLVMRLARPRSKVWWTAWFNLLGVMRDSGAEEAAWREGVAMLSAAKTAPQAERPSPVLLVNAANVTGDLPLQLSSALKAASVNGVSGTFSVPLGPLIADIYANMHDFDHAARYLAASDPDGPATKGEALLLPAYAALDRGDPAGGVAPLEALNRLLQTDPIAKSVFTDTCLLGLAYGLTGRLAEAEAVFKLNKPLSDCYAAHGEALVHAGDVATARRVWSEGLRLAPDLPSIYVSRARFELSSGDLAAAEADFATAHAKSPHFADPLKFWGDVLAKEGRWKPALAKYDEALLYAPAWSELRQARNAVARKG